MVAAAVLLKWRPLMRVSYPTDEWKSVVPVRWVRNREGVTSDRVVLLMLISR